LVLFCRQPKKKKTSASENKVSEEITLDHTIETKQEDEVDDMSNELEKKVDKIEELEHTELDINPITNDKKTPADESVAEVESLPESQPEQPVKTSKSSKRSDRKSKSRSSRASKYIKKCIAYIYF